MKNSSSFLAAARAIIAAVLLISSVLLTLLSLNIAADMNRALDTKTARPMLLGPGRAAEPSEQLGNLKPSRKSSVAPAGSVTPAVAPAPTPSSPVYIGFENFEAPGTLVQVTSSSQGPQAHTVEYLAHDAGEPSIGNNWNTGRTSFQSDLETAFVTFDDSCPVGGQKASWYMSQAPTSQFIDSDPILFTDHITGRTFCGQLTLTTPTCKISFTDTDGLNMSHQPGADGWTASTSTLGSGIDHETIGGGPYAPPLNINPPSPIYPHAVYFASQDLVTAFCLRSDDGGQTWGPPVAMYTTECSALHGHPKVAPDGTVYIPNNKCGGTGGVVVSTDNGIMWVVHSVPNTVSNPNIQDPAVAVDNAGRVYFVIASATGTGSQAIVATSTDQGQNWQNTFDVGAAYGLSNIAFPAAVAGDAGRAAVAFYGSTTSGDESGNDFTGIWHLYVAETFDGGATWTTVDATPNAPIQRGCIWMHGGVDICRNLLDFFDMTVDKQGRVEVGYVNGCAGGNCIQAAPTAFGNAYTDTGTIARQSSGKRLFSAFDPLSTTSVPGMPSVAQRRVGAVIHLSWSEADTGNSPITGYQILRGTASNAETPLTTVSGTQTGGTYDDLTATDTTKTYYYKVLAINAVGASCGNNEVVAPYVGNGCSGIIVRTNDPSHPESASGTGVPQMLMIDHVAVGEPPNSTNLMFQMKTPGFRGVGLPPNSRWRIVWNSYASPGEQYYVGMQTDQNANATFDYGTIMTGAIPPVVGLIGVPIETSLGAPLPSSNFQVDGTITIFVPKSAVGNPQPGDLLGAVNGRTFTGDTPETVTLERNTLLVDHTFVKAQRDNGAPAATYTVLGNNACEGGIVPTNAVSRKNHDGAGTFDVDLPLSGSVGIECRTGQGPNSDQHQVVVTFKVPIINVGNAIVSSGTGSVSTFLVSGNQVFVDLTGVANAQTITITLSAVNDGTNVGDVSIPMGVLLGDVNASRRVDAADVSAVRQQTLQPIDPLNFREDINASGRIDAADVSIARQQTLTSLP